MAELVKIFSDPNLLTKPRFRCSVEGPDEFDVMFESIMEEQFGYDPNSNYKNWVRRLYSLGLIPGALPALLAAVRRGPLMTSTTQLVNNCYTELLVLRTSSTNRAAAKNDEYLRL
jgi:hypothetical protein